MRDTTAVRWSPSNFPKWDTPLGSPPDCHSDEPYPPDVIYDRCLPTEFILENRCRPPFDGRRMSETDHLAVFTRGKSIPMGWVAERIAPMMPYLIYDKTSRHDPTWETDPRVFNRTVRIAKELCRLNEGDGYLSFIAQHYDCLPRVTAFLHEHEDNAVHLIYQSNRVDGSHLGNVTQSINDTVPDILAQVCWDKVTGAYSFQGLVTSIDEFHPFYNATFDEWSTWMPDAAAHRSPDLIFHCCGTFLAHRDAIRRRPKEFYLHLLRMGAEGRVGAPNPAYILEFSWDYIFQETKYLPALLEYSTAVRRNSLHLEGHPLMPERLPPGFPPPQEIFGCDTRPR